MMKHFLIGILLTMFSINVSALTCSQYKSLTEEQSLYVALGIISGITAATYGSKSMEKYAENSESHEHFDKMAMFLSSLVETLSATKVRSQLLSRCAESKNKNSMEGQLANILLENAVMIKSRSTFHESTPNFAKEKERFNTLEKTSTVELNYVGDSWTEIYDREGKKLFFDIGRANKKINVKGLSPFTVFLGNASLVKVKYNNKNYDISQYLRGKSARFKIGSKKTDLVTIKLPESVTVDLPGNWVLLTNNQKVTLNTLTKSILDIKELPNVDSKLPFAANYYVGAATVGIVNIRYYPATVITQADAKSLNAVDIRDLDQEIKNIVIPPMEKMGIKFTSWEGTKKRTINGITTFITEYHRKALNGAGIFRVRLVRVFAGSRSFTFTVSYLESQSMLLQDITDRMISSLAMTDYR